MENIFGSNENQYYVTPNVVLYSKDMLMIISYPACNYRIEYEIPYVVKEIKYYAFENSAKHVQQAPIQ